MFGDIFSQFMTAPKAMTALGLMNVRALEHPITGTQYLQEKVAKYIFFSVEISVIRREILFILWKTRGRTV